MNKKLGTVLFTVLATMLNLLILTMTTFSLITLFAYAFKDQKNISAGLSAISFIVILIGSIALTWWIYAKIVKWVFKKWSLDKHMEPLFPRRGRR